jgi:cyclic pyranopterin phosphate synthase
VDLRSLLRDEKADADDLRQALVAAMDLKPEKHHFDLDAKPDIVRFMNMTGG